MTVTNKTYTHTGPIRIHTWDRSRGTETVSTGMTTSIVETLYRDTRPTTGYYKLKDSPNLPNNPYQLSRVWGHQSSGYLRIESDELAQGGPFVGQPRYITTHSGFVGNDYGPPNVNGPPDSVVAAMDRKLINELLLKIKDQKVNLAQAAAERAATARTIADAATAIAKSLVALKQGNFVKAANALGLHGKQIRRQDNRNYYNQQRSIAKGWLALQYGWKPLLNDIYGAAQVLAELNKTPVEKVVKQRTIKHEFPSSGKDAYGKFTYEDYERSEYTIRYVCSFTLSNAPLKKLSELGITNPALIAWELLPWSFVIDWFIPIGDFVSACDATNGLTFRSGTKTTFLRGRTTRAYTHLRTSAGKATGYAVARTDKVDVLRTVLRSFPAPQLPQFQNPLSMTHLANAMALLRGLRK
jgi:hypothetical protein